MQLSWFSPVIIGFSKEPHKLHENHLHEILNLNEVVQYVNKMVYLAVYFIRALLGFEELLYSDNNT